MEHRDCQCLLKNEAASLPDAGQRQRVRPANKAEEHFMEATAESANASPDYLPVFVGGLEMRS